MPISTLFSCDRSAVTLLKRRKAAGVQRWEEVRHVRCQGLIESKSPPRTWATKDWDGHRGDMQHLVIPGIADSSFQMWWQHGTTDTDKVPRNRIGG